MDPIKLQAAIELAGAQWQAGPTSVSHLSDEEKQVLCGYVPGPDEPSLEEQERIADANYQAFQASASLKISAYPAAYDLRTGGFVTPVKNQGGCGSCVSFGTIATIEATFRRQRNNPNLAIDLSEAHLFYCYAKSKGFGCSTGWYPDQAMEMSKQGIVDDACYPYTAGDQNCTLCGDWQNRLVKITNYQKITDIGAMKDWLANRGALSACFTVYNDFYSYRSGVYRHVTGGVIGGHCVSIVGYDDNLGCWICKNSWGEGFGEQGYFKIAYGQCGIESWVYAVEGIVETGWLTNVKVQGLWTNNADLNSYVYLSEGIGWRKLCTVSVNAHLDMLTQLAASKAQDKAVNVYQTAGILTEVYAW
jgi:C1A family cysteine protease